MLEKKNGIPQLSAPFILALGAVFVAILLLAVTLAGPENLRRAVTIGSPTLLILIAIRQWLSSVENETLSRRLQQQLLDFNQLIESGKIVASMMAKGRLEEIYSAGVKIAQGLVQADVVALPICNGDGTFTYADAYGRLSEILKGQTLPTENSGLCQWLIRHQQPLVAADLRSESSFSTDLIGNLEMTTALGIPLFGDGGMIGGILAFRRGDPFTSYDAQILTIYSNHLAIAIENTKNFQSLESRLEALKQAQAQLVQSEKMAAVGQLVAGVAHELNNPLTSILGFAEILKDQSQLDASHRFDLERIYQEAERARRIIQNLLRFSRQEEPSRQPSDINHVVDRTLALREYQLRVNNINLVKHLDPRLPLTVIDEHEMEQVFLNILLNAEQAILESRDRGEIVVTTRLEASNEISISFRDDGPGIKPEHLPKLFEPFFTTKEVGKGTGLGLALVYGILKQHTGKIRVESESGHGACFIISLPVRSE